MHKTLLTPIISLVLASACSKTVLDTTQLESKPAAAPKSVETGELTVAAFEGDISKVKELLMSGAYINENIGDSNNQITPLLAALINNQDQVVQLLIDRGASTSPSFRYFNASDLALYLNKHETRKIIIRGEQ
jgi:ankyrin repeat protein